MANLNELKPIINLNPFAKFCCTIGNLPSSYMASLTYEEQLMWLCDYLKNTVIPTVNNNAECVKELQEKYVEFTELTDNKYNEFTENIMNLYNQLKSYVDNYFNNLDVQNEINIKLDIMATDGTLDKIINQDIFSDINNKIDSLELSFNDFKNFYGYNYIVDINGNGDFTSISECVNNANNNEKIFIKNGTYNNEIINCNSKKLTLVGESKNNVIIKNTTGSYASAPIMLFILIMIIYKIMKLFLKIVTFILTIMQVLVLV